MQFRRFVLAATTIFVPCYAWSQAAPAKPPETAANENAAPAPASVLRLGGPFGAPPTLAGTGYQLYLRRYLTGTARSGINASLIHAEGDTATVTGPNFLNLIGVQHSFGGLTTQGGRQAIQAAVDQTAPTSAANRNRNYVGGTFIGSSSSGDGGTDLGAGARGAYFGINPMCILKTGATGTLNCSAGEINVAVATGASTRYKSGLQIAQLPYDAVRGAAVDAALSISNQPGAVGWKNGILFGTQNGQYPIAPDGYLLLSYGPGVANVAITARGVIQTSDLAGTGRRVLSVDPDGTLTAKPTAVPASASAACAVGQQAVDAAYLYACVAPNTWKRAPLSSW